MKTPNMIKHNASRALRWLERHGIDCSRDANEGDFIAIVIALGAVTGLFLLWVSPWWSGFTTATTVLWGFYRTKDFTKKNSEIATSKELEAALHLCQVYNEIALSAGLTDDEIREQRIKLFGA